MKIVHIGLADSFTEGMSYQGNLLSHQNIIDGNDVLFISNAQKFVDGKLVYTDYEDYVTDDGIRLIRLPYVKILGNCVSQKIRFVRGLYKILEDYSPDIIFSHSLDYLSVLDVIKYNKNNKNVKFFADTHASIYNSATNWLSKYILHKGVYRFLTKMSMPYIERYFYIGESERIFAKEYYKVIDEKMELFPLGGILLDDNKYYEIRNEIRRKIEIEDGQLLFVHSGKMTKQKKTIELLRAFKNIKNLEAKLLIIGSFSDDIKEESLKIIDSDDRIKYLGWMDSENLQNYLAACDLYLQPGSVSATMQNAVCMRCPVMTFPHLPYTTDLDYGNLIWVKTQSNIEEAFIKIASGEIDLVAMSKNSERCGKELLDYRKLADRLYH